MHSGQIDVVLGVDIKLVLLIDRAWNNWFNRCLLLLSPHGLIQLSQVGGEVPFQDCIDHLKSSAAID